MTLDPLSDTDLVAQCLDGKPEAWDAIVHRYRRLVYSVPSRMRLRPDQCDEVFQDTFTTLLEKLATLKDRERVGLWLAVTARRKALDRLRRGPAVHEVGMAEGFDAPAATELTVDDLIRLEQRNTLRHAVESLPANCRELLHALFYEDPPLSYKDVALRLKLPEGSLGPTRSRCFAKLRKLLGTS